MKLIYSNLVTVACLLLHISYSFQTQTTTIRRRDSKECVPRDYGRGSFVCVCNNTYCDTLEPLPPLKKDHIVIVTSDKESKRWHIQQDVMKDDADFQEELSKRKGDVLSIVIDRNKTYQTINGFGGAFTDATGFNLQNLRDGNLREELIKGYYDLYGLEYNIGRVPIGGADFSTHPYSYDDLPHGQTDPELKYFRLMDEDTQLKIPMITYASDLCKKRGTELFLFGSPWGSPGWMKENGQVNGKGKLLKQYYPTWASYFIKFLDEYKAKGVEFDAVTTQNEPTQGLYNEYPFNGIGWLPQEQGTWVSENLGPQMHDAGYGNIKILIVDDSRNTLHDYVPGVMEVANASAYVSGIAVHWYADFGIGPSILEETHLHYPQLPILYTEACTGSNPIDIKVVLGNWSRGESYAQDIIENLNHWVVGWTDWNMALDLIGGPNWVKNFVDSPVIVNKTSQEFYRQPMFYSLAHFSKIIPRGSVRVDVSTGKTAEILEYAAVKRPDDTMALIVLNLYPKAFSVSFTESGKHFVAELGPRSLTSFVWKI